VIGEIASVGARGPLGLSSLQLAMSLRAQKLEPRTLSLRDNRNRPIGMCLTGGIGARVHGYERLLTLAAPALAEALDGGRTRGALAAPMALPLIVVLPEPGRPDDEPTFAQLVLDLGKRAGAALDLHRSRTYRLGHAGFAHALLHAQELLAGGAPAVVVGGVDSYYHPGVLRWLDDDLRLHAPEVDDGFLPSEGAAFLVLTRGRGHSLARVLWAGEKDEASVAEDAPATAEAMTQLLAEQTNAVGAPEMVVADLNGERWRTSEWSLASGRGLSANATIERWVTTMGDSGAATGPLFAAIVCRLWEVGAMAVQRTAIALHSEGSARGLVALEGTGRS
jgi:3-oxoacyl-[acyl-carrier-protein] synthase-1